MSRAQFAVFNLLFIVLYQNAILVLITLPALTAFENRDAVRAARRAAHRAVPACCSPARRWPISSSGSSTGGRPRTSPRVASRPRAFCRPASSASHGIPNFFFEQSQWWVLFLFGAVAAGSLLQWTVLGALLLTALFVGSTIFTESITKSKYPEYADYQATTSAIVPWFPRRARQEAHAERA